MVAKKEPCGGGGALSAPPAAADGEKAAAAAKDDVFHWGRISIRNESDVDLMGILSQLTPLHWKDTPIAPGATADLKCGKAFFTVSVNAFDVKRKPTTIGVGARLAAIVSATVMSGPFLAPAALALVGGTSAMTSHAGGRARRTLPWRVGHAFKLQGCLKHGVYADGKTLVVKGVLHADGTYQLYFDRVEWRHADTGKVTKLKQLRRPKARTTRAPVCDCETVSGLHLKDDAAAPPLVAA